MAAAAEVTGHVHKSRTVQHLRPFQRRRNAAAHQQATLAGLGMGVGRFNLGLGSPGLGL
jgi:hypothetical protein